MPQKQKSADEIIADAKAAYKAAGGGQYAKAPYSVVKATTRAAEPAKPAEKGIKKEAHDTGASIKSNMDNARKALAQ